MSQSYCACFHVNTGYINERLFLKILSLRNKFLTFIEVLTQWVACKVSDVLKALLTLHTIHCVHTSLNVRKMNFLSYVYIIFGMVSIGYSLLKMKNFVINN